MPPLRRNAIAPLVFTVAAASLLLAAPQARAEKPSSGSKASQQRNVSQGQPKQTTTNQPTQKQESANPNDQKGQAPIKQDLGKSGDQPGQPQEQGKPNDQQEQNQDQGKPNNQQGQNPQQGNPDEQVGQNQDQGNSNDQGGQNQDNSNNQQGQNSQNTNTNNGGPQEQNKAPAPNVKRAIAKQRSQLARLQHGLSEDQKESVRIKREEMKIRLDAIKELPESERQDALKQLQDELKAWAFEEGIPITPAPGHDVNLARHRSTNLKNVRQ